MPDPLRALNTSDVQVLKDLIAWARSQGMNTRGRFPSERTHAEGDDQMAPEVYVVKTPSAGIPALVSGGTGTGTGSYDEPGSAECDVYMVDETDATPDLRDVGSDLEVFNVSTIDINGGIYVSVVRDKFGHWVVVPGSSAGDRRRFKLKTALAEDGNATGYLVKKVGSVLVTTATEFTVHDGMSEFSGDAGTLGLAEYWDDMGRWEVYQMACDVSDVGGTGTGTP